jgi:glycosyltransferase involved in cell wall biosynthesis
VHTKKIKVVYDCQIFISQKYGGISRYFCELNKFYIGIKGIDCKIIAPLYINEYVKGYELNILGRKKIDFNNKIFNKLSRFFAYLLNILYLLIYNPHLIHATYYYPIILKKKKTKVVLTVYDMIHEIFPDQFSLEDKTIKFKKQAILKADHIICISNSTKRDLIDIYGIDTNLISVIYLGYDQNLKNLSSHSKLNINFKYILYVGLRGGYKNFQKTLEAFSLLCKVNQSINLICFGGPAFNKIEMNYIQTNKIQDKVMHLQGNDNDLAYLYKKAEVFLYPSLYEGFGLPLLESMSCGCPVICGLNSSIEEVVGNAAEIVDVTSHISIAEGISRMLDNKIRRDELIKRGYERIKLFSWDECAIKTLTVYRSII